MTLSDVGLSSRRDQLTIMSDLLEIIQTDQKLTHILYKSNMSYKSLIKYLGNMIKMGLIEERKKPSRVYQATTKGRKFYEMIENKDEESFLIDKSTV